MSTEQSFVVLAFSLAFYFLPTFIRLMRGEPWVGMFFANLIFGWTVIGWIILFFMAFSRSMRITINNVIHNNVQNGSAK